jgi:hypothetical protein
MSYDQRKSKELFVGKSESHTQHARWNRLAGELDRANAVLDEWDQDQPSKKVSRNKMTFKSDDRLH